MSDPFTYTDCVGCHQEWRSQDLVGGRCAECDAYAKCAAEARRRADDPLLRDVGFDGENARERSSLRALATWAERAGGE